MILLLLTALGFVLLAGFFSGSETGFMAVNRLRIEHLSEKGDSRATLTLRLLDRAQHLLSTTLVGANLSVVSVTVILNTMLQKYLSVPAPWANLILTAGLTLLMLVFAEIIPKTIFQARADELSVRVSPVVRLATWLFFPVTLFVSIFSSLVLFLTGSKQRSRTPQNRSREDIELLASIGAEEGIISSTARAFIHSVFTFGSTTAREIMTPLVDVVSLELGGNVNSAVRLIEKRGFSRIPVYRERVDDIMGYVSAFDLTHSRRRDKLEKSIRPALFVPETKRIDSLLLEMRQNKVPIVVVVDEWGGAAGIVTHEDVAEHIVGQIRDRGEKAVAKIRREGDAYLVAGTTDVDLLGEWLGFSVSKDGFETAAGFVEWMAQRIPLKGDSFEHCGYRITVREADATSVGLLAFVKLKSGRK